MNPNFFIFGVGVAQSIIVMGYGLDGLGLIPSTARFFFSPPHPD
jgi:hypothetical protein